MDKLNSLWTIAHPKPAAWDTFSYEEKKLAIRRQRSLMPAQEAARINEIANNKQINSMTQLGTSTQGESTTNSRPLAQPEKQVTAARSIERVSTQGALIADHGTALVKKQSAKSLNTVGPVFTKPAPPVAKPLVTPSRSVSYSPTSSEYLSARSPSDVRNDRSPVTTSLKANSLPNATTHGTNKIGKPMATTQITKQEDASDKSPITVVPRSVLGKRKAPNETSNATNPLPSRLSTNSGAITPTATPVVIYPLPDWYRHVRLPKPGRAGNRDVLGILQEVRYLIQKLENPQAVGAERVKLWNDVRNQVHKVAHQNVSDVLVKQSKLMERTLHGLPQLFRARHGGKFEDCPYDISADAREVFLKWCRQDFEHDILRGITCGKTLTVQKNFPKLCAPDEFGEGDLVPGQWWPRRVCANRDGAHGPPVAGIYGKKAKGAMSVIMSHGNYQDVDNGEVIQYCGTEGDAQNTTADTKLLRTSYHTGKPVRVMRTERLSEANPYRPKRGIRYDGLYQVTGEELIKPSTSHYRFRMERLPGQDPIRYTGPEARPYAQEVEAYDCHIDLMRGTE